MNEDYYDGEDNLMMKGKKFHPLNYPEVRGTTLSKAQVSKPLHKKSNTTSHRQPLVVNKHIPGTIVFNLLANYSSRNY